MTSPQRALSQDLSQVDIPRPQRPSQTSGTTGTSRTSRPHVDARTTGWLIQQRERIRELELENSRQSGELEVSARVERGAQRFCDRLERELTQARQREASLARALGYAEAERDQLQNQLNEPVPRRLLGRRKRR